MIKIEEGKQYTTGKWKEHTNYKCTQCQYATIDLDGMQRHWDYSNKHKHVWANPKQEVVNG